jgi:hypothetical protein
VVEADPLYGDGIDTYPSDRARLLIPACLIVGIVAVVLNFTIATVETWGPPVTVLVMSAVALAAGWRVLHLWNREVILYHDGFSYREGGRTVFFMYEEIRSIRQQGQQLAYFGGLLRRSTLRFTLTTVRDERIVLTSLYRRVEQLGARLEVKVNATLEPIIRSRLEQGDKVLFSDTLRLSRDGLHENGRNLPWPAFGGYKISGGHLRLLSQDGDEWLSLPLGEVDNITLLLPLLKQHQPAT